MKSSHPTTPERFIAIETTVEEIRQKIGSGQPLKPELKNAGSAVAREEVQAIPH
jgi:beta-barrel assembly-enhancing protease